MNLLILASGSGMRFASEGYEVPKPMIEILGKSFLEVAYLGLTKVKNFDKVFVTLLQSHIDQFGIDRFVKARIPDATLVVFSALTRGPAASAALAIEKLCLDGEILIADCDQVFQLSEAFEPKSDASLFSFKSTEPHFSYAKILEQKVVEIREKKVISEYALAGAYYFMETREFLKTFKSIENDSDQEIFISEIILNYLSSKKNIAINHLSWHQSFGTPKELAEAERNINVSRMIEFK